MDDHYSPSATVCARCVFLGCTGTAIKPTESNSSSNIISRLACTLNFTLHSLPCRLQTTIRLLHRHLNWCLVIGKLLLGSLFYCAGMHGSFHRSSTPTVDHFSTTFLRVQHGEASYDTSLHGQVSHTAQKMQNLSLLIVNAKSQRVSGGWLCASEFKSGTTRRRLAKVVLDYSQSAPPHLSTL